MDTTVDTTATPAGESRDTMDKDRESRDIPDEDSRKAMADKLGMLPRPSLGLEASADIMERVRRKAKHRRIRNTILILAGIPPGVALVMIIVNVALSWAGIDASSHILEAKRVLAHGITVLSSLFATTAGKAAVAASGIWFLYSIIGDMLSARLERRTDSDRENS